MGTQPCLADIPANLPDSGSPSFYRSIPWHYERSYEFMNGGWGVELDRLLSLDFPGKIARRRIILLSLIMQSTLRASLITLRQS